MVQCIRTLSLVCECIVDASFEEKFDKPDFVHGRTETPTPEVRRLMLLQRRIAGSIPSLVLILRRTYIHV
jgi:hypothetical protein